MGTPLSSVYSAFLVRVHADDWMLESEIELAERDWREFLEIALFRLKYPRVSLEIDDDQNSFVGQVGRPEIQVLGVYMKHEWVKRCIANWQKIKSYYSDRDFSEANHLDKLNNVEAAVDRECAKMYGIYDRAHRNPGQTGFEGLAGKS